MRTPSSLQDLHHTGLVAVIRAPDVEGALGGVEALVAGGITGIEITYSTPDAASVVRELDRRYGDKILLGVGTILDADQAVAATEAGARFLVSPGMTDRLAEKMLATGLPVLAGAWTPSEVMRLLELGMDGVKLFPASTGGIAHLRSLRGPFPDVAFVPTGGVTVDNLGKWLAAGVIAVGIGGELCPASDLAARDYPSISERARRFASALIRHRQR